MAELSPKFDLTKTLNGPGEMIRQWHSAFHQDSEEVTMQELVDSLEYYFERKFKGESWPN